MRFVDHNHFDNLLIIKRIIASIYIGVIDETCMQHKTKPGFKWSFAEFKNALKASRLFFASFLLAIKEMKENHLLIVLSSTLA